MPPRRSSPRSTRAGWNASCATSSPTPSTTPSTSRCGSGWASTRTRSPSRSATTASGCGPARRSWCSAGSGAPTRRGCAARAAPGSAWRSASRTPGCTRAGWRRGASRQGRLLPADPAAGPRPQGDDESTAAETRWARTKPRRSAKEREPAGEPCETRPCGVAALFAFAMVLAGCAGVPSSSAPQAIGTVDRPAPPSLPKPTPGMDPDVLLREFLKATADPVQPASGRAAVPHRIGVERLG